jgi:O-antigen/teichoic acid export membrane protein
MQLLCIGGAFVPLNTLFSNLIISQGKSNIYMWNVIAQVVLQLATVLLIARFGGNIYAMVIAGVCINVGWLFVWQRFARRFIRLSLRMLLLDLAPFLLTALAACASGWAITAWMGGPLLITFLTKIIVAAGCYFFIMRLARAEILQECIDYLFRKKRA